MLFFSLCPSPHANGYSKKKSQKIFQGDWYLSLPKKEIKRPQSACPYWAGIWQRSEVAPRHHGEEPKITLSAWNASKLFTGLRPPRESFHSSPSVPNHIWPWQDGGVGLSHYSKWQLVVSLWWGRNDDSDSPSSPTNSAHSGTCVIIITAETNPHGFCAGAHSTGPDPLQIIRPISHLSPEHRGKLPILTSSSALSSLWVAKHEGLRHALQGIFLGLILHQAESPLYLRIT